jgi:hypothetical protein
VRDTLYQVHTTHSSSFLGLSPSSGVQAASNGATDAVIALIDTGIYPKDRASFAAAEKISWRLRVDSRVQWHGLLQQQAGGRQDVLQVRGGDGPPDRREAESKSLIDTDGHDTHSGGRQPVQLRARHGGGHGAARVAAYKVCWKQGCAGSDILVGIDQAITDSVNVILLSLGGGWSLSTRSPSPCSASSAKGIVLSTSANNDAPGKSTVSNATPWVITVDASTMNRQFPASSETANVLSARRCTRATRTGR